MDKIFLRQLKVDAVIGIWEWERRVKQTVSIDLEIGTDVKAAAAEDSMEKTLSYKDVAKRLLTFVGASEYQLIESLAEAVARVIIEEFEVPWVKVSVAKPEAIRGSQEVGITIERTPEDYAD